MEHTCAILEDGSLVCWGKNDHGQIGTGSNSPNKVLVPTLVNQDNWPSGRTVLDVGTGDDHTCALLDNNSVYCWGRDNAAQLGSGDTSSNYNPSPTQLFGDNLSKIAIDSMGDHSCVLIENGSIYCWGRQSHGQIGDGTPYGEDIFVYSPSLVETHYSFLTEANSLKRSKTNVTGATCSVSPDLPDAVSYTHLRAHET